MYFSQYGALECAEVMKDRYTGKSRGFGFVTFLDPCSATRALAVEHTIDGRRCEAKVALPKVRVAGSPATPGPGVTVSERVTSCVAGGPHSPSACEPWRAHACCLPQGQNRNGLLYPVPL
jgi:RNA recognition motif-containing protein